MKKGFTMIELVITIGLICLIGGLVVANLSTTFTEQQQKQYEAFKEVFENAACNYLDLSVAKTLRNTCRTNGSCTISVSTLLSEGLITEDDLRNPKTESNILTTTAITVTYTNGVRSCKYPD